jgi:NitT/TauT family transport system permease protein
MCSARSKGRTMSQRIGGSVPQSALTGPAAAADNVPTFRMVTRALRRHLPPVLLFAALLAAWQLAVTVFRIREYLLPGPWAVLRAALDFKIPWWSHLWVTSAEIVGAFLLAGVVGVLLGTAIAWSAAVSAALVPFLVFVNTLPKVAVAPLFLLWLGYGIFPNMLIGALIGFFPVVINTAVGLTQVDQEMLDLGRVFGAPKWKVFLTIRIPNAFPYVLSALKITATAAVVGAIVGEFVASQSGLGSVIVVTQTNLNTPVAFAALVWISVVGLVLYGAVGLAARWLAPWAETGSAS